MMFGCTHPFVWFPLNQSFNNLHLVWSESYPSVPFSFALHRVLSDVKSERRASNMASQRLFVNRPSHFLSAVSVQALADLLPHLHHICKNSNYAFKFDEFICVGHP